MSEEKSDSKRKGDEIKPKKKRKSAHSKPPVILVKSQAVWVGDTEEDYSKAQCGPNKLIYKDAEEHFNKWRHKDEILLAKMEVIAKEHRIDIEQPFMEFSYSATKKRTRARDRREDGKC